MHALVPVIREVGCLMQGVKAPSCGLYYNCCSCI